MDREKFHEFLDLVLDIVEAGKGEGGFPFVNFSVSNYPVCLVIQMKDDGFKRGIPFDGFYQFSKIEAAEKQPYKVCQAHLKRLKDVAESMKSRKERHGDAEN